MKRAKITLVERADRLTSSEDREPVRVIAPQLGVVELEYQIVRSVINRVDLFEHDFALESKVRSAQGRTKDQVSENVGGLRQVFVENLGLIGRMFPRGVGVE